MKILVTGDRNGYDLDRMTNIILSHKPRLVLIGNAKGVDTEAKIICIQYGIPFLIFYANWVLFDKYAGPLRNQTMLDEKPDLVLAFHKDINNSKGTKNCIEQAKKLGIKVELHE